MILWLVINLQPAEKSAGKSRGADVSLELIVGASSAFDNLVSNAVQYTQDDFFVDIKWCVESHGLSPCVKFGPGVQDRNEKMFTFLRAARKQGPLKV